MEKCRENGSLIGMPATRFGKRWVDLVVVLRCERTDVLWDRLKARYAIRKYAELGGAS